MGSRWQVFLWGALGLAGGGCSGQGTEGDRLGEQVATVAQAQSGATCVTLQRGGAGAAADAQITSSRPQKNLGDAPQAAVSGAQAGEAQALLRFDLGPVPANISLQSATLRVRQTNTGHATVRAHRALAPWDEGSVTWSSFGGAHAPAVEAQADNGGPGGPETLSLDVTALAQAWVDRAAPNHGVLLEQAAGGATRIRTSEQANAEARPQLEVCYVIPPPPSGTSLMVQVLDADGAPVPLAGVMTPAGLRPTDGAGRLVMEELTPGRFVASVEAAGHAPASVVAELSAGAHVATEVRLLPAGPPIAFDAGAGAAIAQGSVRVVIPPGAVVDENGLPVSGPVAATVVPFDPTEVSLAALPGPLDGVAAGSGAPVQLEPVFMAEVSLWRGTERLQLAPGASATLEMLLPDTLEAQYAAGDTIPAWWFDLEAGVWREEGAGVIQAASEDPARLAWVVEVNHFTWWNADNPWTNKHCLDVLVLDPAGNPAPNVPVSVQGLNYIGISTTRFTGPNGRVCVEFMRNGVAEVFASAPGTPLATQVVIGSGGAMDCSGNGEPGATCQSITLHLPAPQICAPGSCQICAPIALDGVGICRSGTNCCNNTGTAWSSCGPPVSPALETCAAPFDENCNGQVNESGAGCVCNGNASPPDEQPCYGGPPGTEGVGLCLAGVQACRATNDGYGPCVGQVVPALETCATPDDDDCDGSTDCCDIVEWVQSGSGTGGQLGYEVAIDGASNVFVAGEISSPLTFGGIPVAHGGSYDAFVAGVDPSGGVLWARSFGDGSVQRAYDVAVDANGDVLIVGWLAGSADFGGGLLTSAGSYDLFVAKLNGATGNHLWSRRFGDGGYQGGVSVSLDSTGNAAVAGVFNGSLNFGAAGSLVATSALDAYVVMLDGTTGEPIWATQVDGGGDQSARDVVVDSEGNVLLSGVFSTEVRIGPVGPLPNSNISGATADMFVAKLDGGTGAPQWGRRLGGAADDQVFRLASGGAGSAVISGRSNGDIFVTQIAGDDGTPMWSRSYGAGGLDTGWSVAVDNAGNVWVAGAFEGIIDFDPGRDGWVRSSAGGSDILILQFAPDGELRLAKGFPGLHWDGGDGLAVSGTGDVWVTGWFQDTVDFCGASVTSAGGYDLFLARLHL